MRGKCLHYSSACFTRVRDSRCSVVARLKGVVRVQGIEGAGGLYLDLAVAHRWRIEDFGRQIFAAFAQHIQMKVGVGAEAIHAFDVKVPPEIARVCTAQRQANPPACEHGRVVTGSAHLSGLRGAVAGVAVLFAVKHWCRAVEEGKHVAEL